MRENIISTLLLICLFIVLSLSTKIAFMMCPIIFGFCIFIKKKKTSKRSQFIHLLVLQIIAYMALSYITKYSEIQVLDQLIVDFEFYLGVGFPSIEWSALVNDFLMVSYTSYFFLIYVPILMIEDTEERYRFFSAMILFTCIQFIGYLIFPVQGPQYFLTGTSGLQFEFSSIGKILMGALIHLHSAKIDCMPSGHVGASAVAIYFIFKNKFKTKWIWALFYVGIVGATLFLRFHYITDLVVGLLVAMFCIFIAFKEKPVK